MRSRRKTETNRFARKRMKGFVRRRSNCATRNGRILDENRLTADKIK
jgi:hypothetical protein